MSQGSSSDAVRLSDLVVWKAQGRVVVMVTAYDFSTAGIVEAAGV
ncbi:MAG: Ketopantoate hydroxymethyltransferase, partial [Acidimicrobiaceae bacterium]|nr:Ketopantoate hydroxymethyltransferase [Acidimicrobiaceae bacterium]